MKIMRTLGLLSALGALAGCGSQANDSQTNAGAVETTTTTQAAPSTTTTTVPPTTTTTTDPRVVIQDVKTSSGWHYRITIVPEAPDPSPTDDRCVRVAPPGQTNLRWDITAENLLTDRPAPWPSIQVETNLNEAGTAIHKQATTVMKAIQASQAADEFRIVDIAPNETTMCGLRSMLYGGQRDEHLIPPGGSAEFVATTEAVSDPIPAGAALIVSGDPDVIVPAV